MVQQFIKFIQRSPYKTLFQKILKDIMDDNLESYDIKKLQGQPGLYRLKVGSVRFIYRKTEHGNKVLKINNRGDIYKDL